jgi:hypothetical protein
VPEIKKFVSILNNSCSDAGSGAFLTPGSGDGKKTGAMIRDEYLIFENLARVFGVKKIKNSMMRIWHPRQPWIRDGIKRIRDKHPGFNTNI